jgi:hypothetical protein
MGDYQSTQASIVRQSTLKFVGDYCKMIGTPLTIHEIVRMTNVLTDYCQNGYNFTDEKGKSMKTRLDAIDEHIKTLFTEGVLHQ